MILLLNTKLMVREGPRVCHVCRRDMEVSIGSDLVCSCRTVTFRVQTTVDWPRVHWVDTSDGGCSLKLVREQAQLNLLDLISRTWLRTSSKFEAEARYSRRHQAPRDH